MIWAEDASNITISGGGALDGGGGLGSGGDMPDGRGDKMLALKSCHDVTLRDLQVRFVHMHNIDWWIHSCSALEPMDLDSCAMHLLEIWFVGADSPNRTLCTPSNKCDAARHAAAHHPTQSRWHRSCELQ